MRKLFTSLLCFFILLNYSVQISGQNTIISIRGEKFFINGKPTFEGRTWNGIAVEGLLPNSRMVQGVFDDLNPETVSKWKYPDTRVWSADRNTSEFIAAMPDWCNHGLLAFTINFQGGSPEGYSASQPWENNAFEPDGVLRPAFSARMEKIIRKADELGMVVILGIFYFGQDQRLTDENAVIAAVDNTVEWVLKKGFTNVIIEVANECNNNAYQHEIIKQDRAHELILRIKKKAPDLLVSTSFNGNTIPPDKVLAVSDFVLIHGNGVHNPDRITEMVEQVRNLPSYKPMPVVFNEDDHFDFEKPENNFIAATKAYASWGYFDFRMKDEGFDEGYQSVPVNWGISSDRKRGFFNRVNEIFVESVAANQVFYEMNGTVEVEAEFFFKQEKAEIRKWQITDSEVHEKNGSEDHAKSASGEKYIVVLPDTRVTHDDKLIQGENFSPEPGQMAVVSYKIGFKNPGKYYVWVRAFSAGTEDNGIHVGINGQWPESGQRMQWCEGKNQWTWDSKQRTEANHCGEEQLIYLEIPSAGEHIISFSMREDGFRFDKFVLSKAYKLPEN